MGKEIVIIGAGPGGYAAAIYAARLGGKVTLIERDKAGGTCLNWGCIPSKIMKTTADLVDWLHRAGEFGIALDGEFRIDMEALMARKERIVSSQISSLESLFASKGIRYARGKGRIKSQGLLEIETGDRMTEEVSWDALILAPGSVPVPLPGVPFDGIRILSSDHALDLRRVPQSMLIVGGGVIGCEFAHIYSSLGSKITIVEAMDRLLPLPSLDEACSRLLQREMKKQKISCYLGPVVKSAECSGDLIRVSFLQSGEQQSGKNEPVFMEFEKVLVCIGRGPATGGLGLENVGITVNPWGWIECNSYLETRAPDVYAIGDVLGPDRIMLAHSASAEAFVAAENAMGGRRSMDYSFVPNAIFTNPEIASVGLTEKQAIERGYEALSESVLFRVLGKAQAMGEIAGEARLVWEKGSKKILGLNLAGAHATDLIGEACLALAAGCTLEDLSRAVHAHPTLSEIMTEISQKALGKDEGQ
jgi:dihydrolipoamide dehydrogenase